MLQTFIKTPYIGAKNAVLICVDSEIVRAMDMIKKIVNAKKNKKFYQLKITVEEINNE
jgi:hypothetical protein